MAASDREAVVAGPTFALAALPLDQHCRLGQAAWSGGSGAGAPGTRPGAPGPSCRRTTRHDTLVRPWHALLDCWRAVAWCTPWVWRRRGAGVAIGCAGCTSAGCCCTSFGTATYTSPLPGENCQQVGCRRQPRQLPPAASSCSPALAHPAPDYRDSVPEPLETVFRLYQPVVQDGRWTHGLCEMWWVLPAGERLRHQIRTGSSSKASGQVPVCLPCCRLAASLGTGHACAGPTSAVHPWHAALLRRFWKLKPVKHSVHIPW